MMNDVLGQAISDYYHQTMKGKLWIHNKYGKKESMPVDTYFRDEEYVTDLELIALEQCTGTVLDIGAGAGSISLQLQQLNKNVTALEISPLAASVIKLRGVKQVVQQDIFNFKGAQFDTLLLLMNGIGLMGNIAKLRVFLQHAKSLIRPGGQLKQLHEAGILANTQGSERRPRLDKMAQQILPKFAANSISAAVGFLHHMLSTFCCW